MRTLKKMRSSIGAGLMLVTCVAAIAGCGSGKDENPVPPSSSVQIDPAGVEWMIMSATPCPFDPGNYNDSLISIKVINQQGSVLGKVRLTISLDLAGNTYSGTEVLALYEDKNANGIIDDPQEKVSSNMAPIFITETNEYTGDKQLFVRVNLSCPYRGNLNVFTNGDAAGQLNISVQNEAT